MKTSKTSLLSQRRIVEKRLETWRPLRDQEPPPSGWIHAVRGSLGITSRQLADLLGISQGNVVALERREAEGKATFESVQKAAQAMGCRLVYALVPAAPFESLESIIDVKARAAASELLGRVEHTMQLEKQGSDAKDKKEAVERLADQLKAKMDKRLWTAKTARRGKSSG
jgi:predicted DNA-binding mobile mystery protein A